MESYEIGKIGEQIAENYLVTKGYQILKHNYRSQQGEIDLIAKDNNTLVFVEVKNYSFRSYGSPVGAVGKAKKQSLIHAANDYIYKNDIQDTYSRFDVITIYNKRDGSQKIEHYLNAFFIN